MKKILVLLVAVFALSAASFAQRGYDQRGYDNRHEVPYYNNGHSISQNSYGDRNNSRYDRDRQAEWDRINRDYDNRIRDYRNDRRLSRYERDRRIQELERERQIKANSFGKGLAIGGIAGVVLGVILGR